jgi:hypothetical protein
MNASLTVVVSCSYFQEELYRGSSLTSILCGRVLASADLLAMVVCLVANLAVDEGLQVNDLMILSTVR